MGMLVDGVWTQDDEVRNKTDKSGAFKRAESGFRNWITTDGAPGRADRADLLLQTDAITSMWR